MYKVDIRTKEAGSTKGLLKKGLVPGIIYGKGTDSTSVFFSTVFAAEVRYPPHTTTVLLFTCFISLDNLFTCK